MTEETPPGESGAVNSAEDFQDPLSDYEPKTYDDPLQKALAEEPVSSIRSQPFTAVPPDTPVSRAVETLASIETPCLLVTDGDRLVGLFPERVVLDEIADRYHELKDRPVREFMVSKPAFVYETDSSAAALCVMALSGYRHVPVLDLEQRVVGLINPRRFMAFLQEHITSS